ncbi:MAG: redoxin family protein [Cellvibrionaceae bacterium]
MSNPQKQAFFHIRNSQISFSQTMLTMLFLVGTSLSYAGKPLEIGDTAPDWILSNSQSESISFYRDTHDKKSVILFWATWCPYCKALMPELKKLQSEINDPSFKFFALNIWEDSDPIEFLKENDYAFTLILNADKVAKRYKVNGTPGLFVIDENKKIIYKRLKGQKPEDVYLSIKSILNTEPN